MYPKKPTIDREATSQRIAYLMERSGISIREMSEKLGTTYQAIWKYVKNKSLPTPSHLFAMAKILNCRVDDLIVESRCI